MPSSDRAPPILQIAKTDWMRIVMHVPEKEVPLVRRGNTARIKLFGREQLVEGKVARFANSLEDKSRTMQVEIDVPNKDGLLYPGMFGSVALTLREIPGALTVPASALYGSGDQLFVVQVKDGRAIRTRVKTGYDDGTVVQIVDGLIGGEEVVVSNKGDLADGQPVAATRTEGRRVAVKNEAAPHGAGG
jgi:RND family efflux transporter MFP subunit